MPLTTIFENGIVKPDGTYSSLGSRLLAQYGLPMIALCFLGYWIVTKLNADLTFIRENLISHHEFLVQNARVNQEIKGLLDVLVRLNERTCSNTAKTVLERNACFRTD